MIPFARVLLVPQARGVVREVFQKPSKLHLTVGMMKLFSQREKVNYNQQLEQVHLFCLHCQCCVAVLFIEGESRESGGGVH